ncbi:arylamine N-acetyltransferase family protein [Herbihabitans rhizosphaerae]|nr:arylamine N-acetyltransferase [Herbihabitans rhizosphaerae]
MNAPLSTPARTDDWHIDDVDLDAYLARIDHPVLTPSVDGLTSLHQAHVRAIPFENVDVVLGTHAGIGMPAITAKLVDRARGGYCYEHSLLFAAVLERLGFRVTRRMARVQPHKSGPRTHMLLSVHLDGVDHQADVGFGAYMLSPMPLVDGAVVDQAGWTHRITRDGPLWTLAKRVEDGWEPMHSSDELPNRPADYEVAHHYVSTHPHSPFSRKLVVMRLAEGLSRQLVGDELTVEHADGRVERRKVEPSELGTVLRELDVELTDDELAALGVVFESAVGTQSR